MGDLLEIDGQDYCEMDHIYLFKCSVNVYWGIFLRTN